MLEAEGADTQGQVSGRQLPSEKGGAGKAGLWQNNVKTETSPECNLYGCHLQIRELGDDCRGGLLETQRCPQIYPINPSGYLTVSANS